MIWTNQVSLAEALKLQKLLPWTINTDSRDEHEVRLNLSEDAGRPPAARPRDWPGQALPHALCRRVPPSGAAGTRRGKATTSHFWHFNIETKTVTSEAKKIITKKDQY